MFAYKTYNKGDRMGYYIIGNNRDITKSFVEKIKDYYQIKSFNLDDLITENGKNIEDQKQIRKINDIVIKNKEWIIVAYNTNKIDLLCNLANIIIFINLKEKKLFKKYKGDSQNNIMIYLKKHIRKGIILNSKSDIRKFLKSMYES